VKENDILYTVGILCLMGLISVLADIQDSRWSYDDSSK